ncbi:hypothetical protein F5X71_30590 [Nocardia brasiliensis]|uniref:PE domain-containing protein n=1 Tax=Nocardia brasiliensis TaxID=37326 RepID=A0A6G9XYR1_NOCBR|nr:hypothetical protein [Nocardia brasiliensis]QIS06079.1 hypothetical protein F5X71_30590 [Nocardia brasiliensis]
MVDSPFPGYIEDAKSGALQVRMDPQGFVDMDKACQELIDALVAVQTDAREIGERQYWGLGEGNPRLSSAIELVGMFRDKALGGPNNAFDTLTDYIAVAQEIQTMFTAMRDTYARVDAGFAAKLRELGA